MTINELFISYGILTPQALHKAAGVSRQYCYALWSGHRRLGANLARRISSATGIPIADLLTAEPPIPPGRLHR